MAVVCGGIFRGIHKGKYLNGIDGDNRLGIEELCPEGIAKKGAYTLVEQHANKDKFHMYHYTERPIASKVSNDGMDGKVPQIEVKSGGKALMYCAGGVHKDGSLIEILGTDEIATVNAKGLEDVINNICLNYKIPYLGNGKSHGLIVNRTEKTLKEGADVGKRNNTCFKTACNLFEKEQYGLEDGLAFMQTWNKMNVKDSLRESEVETTVKSAWKTIQAKRKHPMKYINKEWPDVAEEIHDNDYFVTLRESKKVWMYDKQEGVYVPNADTYIDEKCQEMVSKCTIRTRNEVKATIKSNKTMILGKELFDSEEINTQNGILDPKDFKLLPHSHKYLTTTKLPFSVNFEANNPKLCDHILTIIDENDINLIMELIWICISGRNPFKKLFVFKGQPNSQKTTLSDIIVSIIGEDNVSREKPLQYLARDSRFSTSKFIGKRMNTASEISNLTKNMIENQKALVGAEKQNTEMKGDNTERYFDPTKFVFLYTTNTLGSIYSSIDDNSIITRYQFLIFRNVIEESQANGLWYDNFFDDDEDKQSAIETVVRRVIEYKRDQSLGKIPKTKWSNVADTKKILQEEMPKEDKYFDEKRIVRSEGRKVSIVDVKKDFESFVRYEVSEVQLGHILKRNGIRSSQSNSMTWYKGWKLSKGNNATLS